MEGDAGPSSQSPSENETLNRTEIDRPNKPDWTTLQYFFTKASDPLLDATPSEPAVPRPRPKNHNFARHALNRELVGRLHPWATSRAHAAFAQGYSEASYIDSHPWRTPVLGAPHNAPPLGICIQCAEFDSTGELLVTGSDNGTVLVHSGESLQQAAWTASFNNLNTLRALRRSNTSARMAGSEVKVDPLLALHSGLSRVQHLRWNPANENVIATACTRSKTVHLFDLQQTQGQPKQIFSLPMQISGGAGDIAFFCGNSSSSGNNSNSTGGNLPGGGYTLVIGGPTGQAFIWDVRMSGPPAVTLQSTRGGAVTSIALVENDHAVVAATQGGDIKAWDLRGGSGGALRFGGIVHHHPILTAVDLRLALLDVPNLAEQAGIVPSSTVHSMTLNPHAPHRAGFHLGCGWSGVLDLRSKRVTHLHAPPQEPSNDDREPTGADEAREWVQWMTMAPHLRRKACWTADGRRFVVPSRHRDALMLLDFDESRHAGCYALLEEEVTEEEDGDEQEPSLDGGDSDPAVASMDVDDCMAIRINNGSNSRSREVESFPMMTREQQQHEDEDTYRSRRIAARRKRNPSAVEVPLSQAAVCAAAMPVHRNNFSSSRGENNVIVVGGAENCLSLVLPF